jgi:uncharacterized protein DUF4258
MAADCDRLAYSGHAQDRMVERGVTILDVKRCLQMGRIVEEPTLNARGHWKMTVHRFAAGEALDVAVVIEMPDNGVVVVTVI